MDSTIKLPGRRDRVRQSDDDRIRKNRERNRIHARNTRERRKSKIDALEMEIERLTKQKSRLKKSAKASRAANILSSLSSEKGKEAANDPSIDTRRKKKARLSDSDADGKDSINKNEDSLDSSSSGDNVQANHSLKQLRKQISKQFQTNLVKNERTEEIIPNEKEKQTEGNNIRKRNITTTTNQKKQETKNTTAEDEDESSESSDDQASAIDNDNDPLIDAIDNDPETIRKERNRFHARQTRAKKKKLESEMHRIIQKLEEEIAILEK